MDFNYKKEESAFSKALSSFLFFASAKNNSISSRETFENLRGRPMVAPTLGEWRVYWSGIRTGVLGCPKKAFPQTIWRRTNTVGAGALDSPFVRIRAVGRGLRREQAPDLRVCAYFIVGERSFCWSEITKNAQFTQKSRTFVRLFFLHAIKAAKRRRRKEA